MPPKVDVKLSQEGLFFPLPLTNATIENVVQARNLLPADAANPRANVISFKVLSAVRDRYSVIPAIGFIAPGGAVTINFSLDPEKIRTNKDPAARELPTERTRDAIYIDFAVVDPSNGAQDRCLRKWLSVGPDSKGINDRRDVQEDASTFWKLHGAVQKGAAAADSGDGVRRRLACVFAARDRVPESLVICMKAEGEGGAARQTSATAPPASRPPTTEPTRPRGTAPPEQPPHRVGTLPAPESTPAVQASPRSTGGAGERAQVQRAPAAAAAAAPAPAGRAAMTKGASLQQAAMTRQSEESQKHRPLWKQAMTIRVPYTVAAFMITLAVYCGLFEEHTFLSWLIAGV